MRKRSYYARKFKSHLLNVRKSILAILTDQMILQILAGSFDALEFVYLKSPVTVSDCPLSTL